MCRIRVTDAADAEAKAERGRQARLLKQARAAEAEQRAAQARANRARAEAKPAPAAESKAPSAPAPAGAPGAPETGAGAPDPQRQAADLLAELEDQFTEEFKASLGRYLPARTMGNQEKLDLLERACQKAFQHWREHSGAGPAAGERKRAPDRD